ncbi:MAG: hypothetical protein R2684_10410 [Pyrinomonadaceae bacterium]
MTKKLFVSSAVVSALIMLAVVAYAYSWLSSIGDPRITSAGYEFQSSLAWTANWAAFSILFVLAVVAKLREGIRWPFGVAFAVFAASLIGIQLSDIAYGEFLAANSLETKYVLLNWFFSGLIVVVVLFLVIITPMLLAGLFGKKAAKPESNEPIDETSES